MTDSSVATDVHEALDVKLDFRAEVTFNLVTGTDDLTDLGSLVVSPVLHFDIFVNAGFVQDFCRATTTYTVDVGQGDLTTLVLREVYTNNSYCHI